MSNPDSRPASHDNWTNLKIAFNRVGQAYFGSSWHKDTILLSPGRFRDRMKDSEIPEIVSWPVDDPMHPFLARTEMESIYQRVAYPAPETMARNYDFVRNNLLRATSQGLLQIEVHEAGKSWLPYESYQSQDPGGDYEISYDDSEIRKKKEDGSDWVEARIEKAGLGSFIMSVEAKIEARQKQSKRINEPKNPLRDNQSPSPENLAKNTEQASLQNLIELMESVFREIKLSSEEPKAAASNAEPPKDQQSPQEQTIIRIKVGRIRIRILRIRINF